MNSLTYLAVFEPSEDNAYSIYFPDLPGCISFGDNLIDGQRMATEALSLHIHSLIETCNELPPSSTKLSAEDMLGNIIMPITVYPDLFQDNRRIPTNTTIPAWLKRLAEENHANYSRLLENALLDYLQIGDCQNGEEK